MKKLSLIITVLFVCSYSALSSPCWGEKDPSGRGNLTLGESTLVLSVKAPSKPIKVFTAGEEDIIGVKNAREKYAQFREQNVVLTNNGTLIVICQARNKSKWSDRSGQDLVVRISKDNGLTWSKARLIATRGLQSISPNAAVYDRQINRIFVLYNLFTWDYLKPPVHIRGEMGETTCRQFIISSDDDGQTWSEPREITAMIDTKGAVAVFGSGEGIQLKYGNHKGRLLISGGDFYRGKKILCFYSDDHGITWQRGNPAPIPENAAMASETKIAELADGTLILNSRTFIKTDEKQRLRTRAFSRDGGKTWSILENDPALITVSCNGSLIAVNHPDGKNGVILLCSVPAGPRRTHGTVYVSLDGGQTWSIKNCSCLTSLPILLWSSFRMGKSAYFTKRGIAGISISSGSLLIGC